MYLLGVSDLPVEIGFSAPERSRGIDGKGLMKMAVGPVMKTGPLPMCYRNALFQTLLLCCSHVELCVTWKHIFKHTLGMCLSDLKTVLAKKGSLQGNV